MISEGVSDNKLFQRNVLLGTAKELHLYSSSCVRNASASRYIPFVPFCIFRLQHPLPFLNVLSVASKNGLQEKILQTAAFQNRNLPGHKE